MITLSSSQVWQVILVLILLIALYIGLLFWSAHKDRRKR
jgi:hypothetical protein